MFLLDSTTLEHNQDIITTVYCLLLKKKRQSWMIDFIRVKFTEQKLDSGKLANVNFMKNWLRNRSSSYNQKCFLDENSLILV